jgi:hypothetical protein
MDGILQSTRFVFGSKQRGRGAIFMKKFRFVLLHLIDVLLIPFIYSIALLPKKIRHTGVHKCKYALLRIGVFPIRNHYYEPQFDYRELAQPLSQDRNLPGIDWNIREQIKLLESFSFALCT